MLKDLSVRSEEPELMDDFQEGIDQLRLVFDDINQVNRVLGGNKITIRAIKKLMQLNPQKKYTIIDMGCGDGDMLREIAAYFRSQDIKVRLIGVDISDAALLLARRASVTYAEIEYVHQDILKMNVDEFQCDIVINTLCMHHFTEEQLPHFIEKFTQLAKIGVVINDLERSRMAYYLFKAFSLIFIRTNTAKIDGLISISKGFIRTELFSYAKRLPSLKHQIERQWAFRFVWVITPNRLRKSYA